MTVRGWVARHDHCLRMSILRFVRPVVVLLLTGCAPIQLTSVDTVSADAASPGTSAAPVPLSQEPRVISVTPSAPAGGVDIPASTVSVPDAPADTTIQESVSLTASIPSPETFALSDMLTLTARYAAAPVELVFLALNLTVPVEPMEWKTARQNGVKTTYWVLPENAAGWHPDSAGAGEDGNTIISGSHLMGSAVFAPLALGEVQAGQEILLRDGAGNSFAYTVTEVSEPLAIDEDPEATATLLDYMQAELPAGVGRLTLLSGWPDFTTTHRIVVVAERSEPLP